MSCADTATAFAPFAYCAFGSAGWQAACYRATVEHITIANGVTTIPANAFKNCDGIANITIPGSVTSIAATAFSGCPNVQFLCTSNNAAASFAQANGIPFRVK